MGKTAQHRLFYDSAASKRGLLSSRKIKDPIKVGHGEGFAKVQVGPVATSGAVDAHYRTDPDVSRGLAVGIASRHSHW